MPLYLFNIDPDGIRHFEKHNISIDEIDEIFTKKCCFTIKRNDKSYITYGKLKSGRYIQIIYRITSPDTYFIITAYDIENKTIIHLLDEEFE